PGDEELKPAKGTRREPGDHIVFRVPARPARALDQEPALLAVEREEVRAVAVRQFDAVDVAQIEAAFVVYQQDVRTLARRFARIGRAGRERTVCGGVRFVVPPGHVLGDIADAGTREGGHVVDVAERFAEWEGNRKGECAEAAGAGGQSRQRSAP